MLLTALFLLGIISPSAFASGSPVAVYSSVLTILLFFCAIVYVLRSAKPFLRKGVALFSIALGGVVVYLIGLIPDYPRHEIAIDTASLLVTLISLMGAIYLIRK
jgi:hypothetical protein